MVAFKWSPIAACFLLLQATAFVSSQAVTVTVSAQSTDYSVLRSIESELVSLEAATITSVASAAASATSSSAAQTYTVSVGIDHKFRPDVVQANAGDIVEFNFFPPNHSVVRAEYMLPCIPYENTGRGKVGFFSGFRPVDAFLDDPPTWNLRINDTDPIFYYCSAPGSCNNFAMIGVINPNKSVSLETQRSLALQAAYVMNPGDPFPPEASSSMASLTASPTSTSALPSSTAATASTTPTPAPAEEEKNDDDLSTGAIIGIALGGAAILLLAAALFYYFFSRSRTLKQPFASPLSHLLRVTARICTNPAAQFSCQYSLRTTEAAL
ncbi:hypothetical protein H2199_006345 [Coniosporium tulheliwenetii]|uniref:Uncharacterized protein n=1 Tax=Coniosporium tulheliwenetii TaxID=3383036 RepID=A0ACC2YXG4_9PEZI|nr:hypothetical protein H2199_006345 [Cladosporium sp. JES 115]